MAAMAFLAIAPTSQAQLTIAPEATRSAFVDVLRKTCVTTDLFPSPYKNKRYPAFKRQFLSLVTTSVLFSREDLKSPALHWMCSISTRM